MSDHAFMHMFPEWMLSNALNSSSRKAECWTASVVHPTDDDQGTISLGSRFPLTRPNLIYEQALTKDRHGYYGIDREFWLRTFWGLRPDFTIESQESGVLVLLEAKGSEVPPRTWKDPKELVYHTFLKECRTFAKKGFYYVVPEKFGDQCRRCLRQYFPTSDDISSGMLFWEDLLPIFCHELLGTAVDFVIDALKGVKVLRERQRELG